MLRIRCCFFFEVSVFCTSFDLHMGSPGQFKPEAFFFWPSQIFWPLSWTHPSWTHALIGSYLNCLSMCISCMCFISSIQVLFFLLQMLMNFFSCLSSVQLVFAVLCCCVVRVFLLSLAFGWVSRVWFAWADMITVYTKCFYFLPLMMSPPKVGDREVV